MIRSRHLGAALLALGSLSATLGINPAAHAQAYPVRPIRVVVPFSPGGAADTPGRILFEQLSRVLGQQVIDDNRPGAGSTIGASIVAKAAPDGYTLLMISNTHVISAALYKHLPYDCIEDFTPILQFGDAPNVLVVNPSLPAHSVKQLIALAKKEPGKILFGSSGNGSSQQLFGELFMSMAHIKMTHVPYKGSGQARADLISGQVSVGFPGISSVISNIKAGRLRALGVTGLKRAPQLPNVPTISEAGVKGYDAVLWLGLVGPKGLPEDVIARLNTAVQQVLKDPALKEKWSHLGTNILYRGPQAWGEYLKAERVKWAKVVKMTGEVIN